VDAADPAPWLQIKTSWRCCLLAQPGLTKGASWDDCCLRASRRYDAGHDDDTVGPVEVRDDIDVAQHKETVVAEHGPIRAGVGFPGCCWR
jgi:hypothetical protein